MIMERKKIVYVSGTRADFGLMTPVLKAIESSETLSLQVYSTGMHCMSAFGATNAIVTGEFPTAKRIEVIFNGNTPSDTVKFIADLLSKITDVFEMDRPDLVLLLGDRPEMLAVATACVYLGIPTAHLHGGERTGTTDEIVRHAITKLSSLHFPATQDAADRIKHMGEDEWRIQIVGAPALDTILEAELPSKGEVASFVNLSNEEKFILLVQHPSGRVETVRDEIEETLSALRKVALPVVAVYPNADAGSQRIVEALEKEQVNPLVRVFKNIPYKMFLAIERDALVWIGNSSAALIESASFKTPVVDIGERQKGRLAGRNVIHAPHSRTHILKAIEKCLHDTEYKTILQTVINPWGDGKTSVKVRDALEKLDGPERLVRKQIAF